MRRCTDELHSCNGEFLSTLFVRRQRIMALVDELCFFLSYRTGLCVNLGNTQVLLSSTLWFVIYSVWMGNKPQVYPKLILPGLVSGIMWGIAMGQLVSSVEDSSKYRHTQTSITHNCKE